MIDSNLVNTFSLEQMRDALEWGQTKIALVSMPPIELKEISGGAIPEGSAKTTCTIIFPIAIWGFILRAIGVQNLTVVNDGESHGNAYVVSAELTPWEVKQKLVNKR